MSVSLEKQFENVNPGDVGIIGDPVDHSLSPIMQNAAFKTWRQVFEEDGKPMSVYHRFHIKSDELKAAIQLAQQKKMLGLNVTVPHKVAVCQFMDSLDSLGQKMKTINTINIKPHFLDGYNTDGHGFERALEDDLEFNSQDKKVLLLGAGGTGRVIAFQLHDLHVRTIYWWNRSSDKIDQIISDSGVYLPKVVPVKNLEELKAVSGEVDLIVNSTLVGMSKEDGLPAPDLQINKTQSVYDVIYNRDTQLITNARKAGAKVANGLGMLIYQGAKSFNIWTGAPAPIEIMRHALENNEKKDKK